jgi:hypothetical protein
MQVAHEDRIAELRAQVDRIMSRVKVGDQVRNGQTIGKIGSTGRSTGSHLHYETRINDEAVDSQRFLRAGLRLGNIWPNECRLLHVLDFFRPTAEGLLGQRGLHEFVEIAVEHAGRV